MKDIKCPICSRKTKLVKCVCRDNKRKRIMIYFPCVHYLGLVYNVPTAMDDNTILKDFKSISEEYFNDKSYLYLYKDRYLDF